MHRVGCTSRRSLTTALATLVATAIAAATSVPAGGAAAGTVDGRYEGSADGATKVAAGTSTVVAVAGRAGVPTDAESLVLTVTVTEPEAPGYLTLFDCDSAQPNTAQVQPPTSTVNYLAGESVPNLVLAPVASSAICIFSSAAAHVIADVSGYFAAGSSVLPLLAPVRLLDTRVGPIAVTVDGDFEGIGTRRSGGITRLTVANRGGIGSDPSAVVLNLAVTEPEQPGYVTAFPCSDEPPNASNINHSAGQTIAGLAVVPVGADGTVCLLNSAATELIADVVGEMPAGSVHAITPVRLLDSRSGAVSATVDGDFEGGGLRAAGSTTELLVTGRGGIPDDATAVVLNLAVAEPSAPGFVTVFECGHGRPLASNVNFTAAQTIANSAVAPLGPDGRVCLHMSASGHLVVDATGWFGAGSGFVAVEPARVLDTRPVVANWVERPVGSSFDSAVSAPVDIDCPAIGVCTFGITDDVGAGGRPGLAATVDAGASWTTHRVQDDDGRADAIDCPSITTCYVSGAFSEGAGALLSVTRDSGRTWSLSSVKASGLDALDADPFGLLDVSCASEHDCVGLLQPLFEDDAAIAIATVDGGASWAVLAAGRLPVNDTPESLDCPTPEFCLVIVPGTADPVPHDGQVLRTTDRGVTWTDVTPGGEVYLEDADCVSESHCYLAGQSTRRHWWRTQDGGNTWGADGAVPVARVEDLSCSEARVCHAVGASFLGGYRVVRTIDGASWSVRTAVSSPLTAVSCPTAQFCAVATDSSSAVLFGDPP